MAAACGHGAMAKLKGALRRLKPTPGDAKTDLLLVIASRLIMNDGNGVAAADVVAACAVPPADAWIRRTFGDGVAITPAMVETALRAAKDHFSRGKDALYHLSGWPLPRRAQCAVGASFVTDDRLGVTPTTPTKEGGGGGGGGGTGGKPAGGGKSKATPPRAGAKRKEREVEEGARASRLPRRRRRRRRRPRPRRTPTPPARSRRRRRRRRRRRKPRRRRRTRACRRRRRPPTPRRRRTRRRRPRRRTTRTTSACRVRITLVPIRPRSRGARRSLRTLLSLPAGVSILALPFAFNPDAQRLDRRLATPTDAPFIPFHSSTPRRPMLPQ